ncbi:DnaE DNA polymerase III, alpha subunit [uncultured Caudovirales phage]|uniref:DNA-directed DNA polymerase n=1 Tax=uncultured Caudovirales phage TaxID=2100421 RepID=A0A6J7WQI3_9CAUD|nr:DnaE DNA polymerase III, alpha subunit [uncultured Caudovirales phage]
MADFFHVHAHSHFSWKDGMPEVTEMVATVHRHGQPALALTDHGVMSGSIRLYKECRKQDIVPFPGEEFYIVTNVDDPDTRNNRYHVGLIALNYDGYRKLVHLSSRSHLRERYHRKPLIDISDLADLQLGYDVALTTGCYFGMPIQALVKRGESAALNVLKAYAGVAPLTFVEIQNHYTDHGNGVTDAHIAHQMKALADEAGLPVIVAQDSHYCDLGDKPVHNLMKQITMFGSDPNDVTFPGDSYHLAGTGWVKDHFKHDKVLRNIWNDSLQSCELLLNSNKLSLPELDTYSFRVPEVNFKKSPDDDLKTRCSSAMFSASMTGKKYEERLLHELRIISDVGFADYFLLVAKITDWCRENQIMVRARGSATGSLVCYLLNITDVDPVRWNLVFERFLTRDRSKPPDIDLDIEDTRRSEVVDWLRTEHDIAQIGTYFTLGYDESSDRGSVVDDYVRMMKRVSGRYNGNYMSDISEDHQQLLKSLASMNVKRSAGSHAAGFVIGTNEVPVSAYLPTMLIPSSGSVVTQPPMDDVEDAGYVKVDLLGIRTLSTLRMCLEHIGRDPADGIDWIPDDDPQTMKSLRTGRESAAIFQLEGGSASRGCREMSVKKTADIVALMALYRPAALDSGYTDRWLSNRRKPSGVTYAHPIIKKHLAETYGVSLYQEQVLGIMRDMGMDAVDLNAILSALKVKHGKAGHSQASDDAFSEQQSKFNSVCAENGLDQDASDEVWELIEGFSAYGFNRAHATSYGVLAYRMAYLKTHHPLEYMAAALYTTVGNADTQRLYVKEARRLGITVRPVNVNRSLQNWTIDGNTLRRGLMSIKGIGERVADEIAEHSPYADIEDMIHRTSARTVTGGKLWKKEQTLTGVMEKLRESGSLESLGVNR